MPADQRAARRAAKILTVGDRRILQRAHQLQRLPRTDIDAHLAQQVREGQHMGENMTRLFYCVSVTHNCKLQIVECILLSGSSIYNMQYALYNSYLVTF